MGSILEKKLATLTGRAPDLCGWALCPGLVSLLLLAALCASSPPPPPPPPLVLFLSSGCLLSFSCPRLGVAGRTGTFGQRPQHTLGERALERLLHVARAPLPSLRMRAPARSVYLLAARSGRAPQVFGGHVTDALWNALAAQFEERCSGLVWRALFCSAWERVPALRTEGLSSYPIEEE